MDIIVVDYLFYEYVSPVKIVVSKKDFELGQSVQVMEKRVNGNAQNVYTRYTQDDQ